MSVKKQAVSLLTGLVMLLTLLMLRPVPVSASNGLPSLLSVDEYVLVDEQNLDFSDNNQYFVWENDDWKEYESLPDGVSSYFQYENGVLTLSNVEIEGSTNNPCGAGINVEGGSLKIVSIGENQVTGVAASNHNTYAAVVTGDNTEIVFAGDGTLTATAAGDASKTSIGINAYNITMESGTVTANGAIGTESSIGTESFGISVRGTLQVEDGSSLIANAADATNVSLGIDVCGQWDENGLVAAGNMVVSGGTVTAYAGNASNESYGIKTTGDFTVSGGTVTANGAEVNGGEYPRSCGIVSDGTLTVENGSVTANGGLSTHESCGVAASTVNVTGGTINATGKDAVRASFGIAVDGDMEVSGSGQVTAIAGEAVEVSKGVEIRWHTNEKGEPVTPGELTISGGTLTATGGSGNHKESYGLIAPAVTVTGGTINATGKDAETASFGIAVDGDMEVSGNGQVNATGGKAGERSAGIDVRYEWNAVNDEQGEPGNAKILGGTVIAKGGKASNESYGIKTTGDLTVTAGTVSAEGAEATGEDSRSCGVVTDGALAVENGTVTATGGLSTHESCGVAASTVNVSDGTLNATGDEAEVASFGIAVDGDMEVSGNGQVNAAGGGTAENPATVSFGISSDAVTVSGGNVQATTGNAINASVGFSIGQGGVTVSGGTVNANVGDAECYSYGISSVFVSVSGNGVVSASAGNCTTENAGNDIKIESAGINVYGEKGVQVSDNGQLTATAGTVSSDKDSLSFGIHTSDMIVSGSATVVAKGDQADRTSSGIISEGKLLISGDASVTSTAAEADVISSGVTVVNGIEVNGGKLVASAKEVKGQAADSVSRGILSFGKMNVSNGTVEATGQNVGLLVEDSLTIGSEDGSAVVITNSSSEALFAKSLVNNGNSLLLENGTGTVNGTVKLDSNVVIPAGAELKISAGSSLTIASGVVLTNNGTISGDGTIYNNGTLANSGSCAVEVVETVVPPVKVEYTIWFNGNGGSVSVSSMTTTGGKLVSLPYITRYGYTFTGWYTADGSLVSTDTIFTGNTTLYAGWKLNEIYIPVEPEVPDYTPVKPVEPAGPDIEWVREDGNTYLYVDDKMITGWYENEDGWYWFDEDTGVMSEDCWEKIDGVWYLFDEDGIMLTGWQKVDGKWYYLKPWGGMATGWQLIDSVWYYLRGDGSMAANAWVQSGGYWYYLTGSGEMATACWIEWKGDWYYLYSSGIMATNTTIDGCYIDSNGIWRA